MNRWYFVLVALVLPGVAAAHDYPTTDRVEYVIECMKDHPGKYEYLYKCSCAIDHIAKKLSYNDYVEESTAVRYEHLGGDGGGEFRDPPQVKKMLKEYKAVRAEANKVCAVQ